MGLILEIIGVVFIIIGVIITATVLGAAVGIPLLINGLTLFAVGAIYRTVKDIQKKIQEK